MGVEFGFQFIRVKVKVMGDELRVKIIILKIYMTSNPICDTIYGWSSNSHSMYSHSVITSLLVLESPAGFKMHKGFTGNTA